MPITELGQLYTPKNAAEPRDQILRDIRLAAIDAGLDEPPVTPGSDYFILATAVANLCLIGFANVAIGLDAQNILTAVGDDLEQLRIGYGLPEVPPSGSTGKIKLTVSGVATLVNGSQFTLPNGLRGQVVGTYVNPADGAEVNVAAVDTGAETNLSAGETVRFVTPPTNIATEAKVSQGAPLTGGTDQESDERKRARILDTLRNKPAGGNWAHIREMALEALGSVVDCYVYPAAGGPGSALVVPVKDFDPDNNDFSRALSSAALQTVQTAIQAQMPTPQEIVIIATDDVEVDLTVELTIPVSSLSGGNGQGWTDAAPWPPLVGGDGGKVTISSPSAGGDSITVSAATTTAPIEGLTHVAWWSSVDRKFTTALVVSVSGSSGAWVLGLDRAFVASDGTSCSGDYLSPAAQNLEIYGKGWVGLFRTLGPGEITTDANRLPRALRHPYVASEDPSDLTSTTLATWVKKFPEVTDYAVGYSSALAPSVPASVADPPQILVPRHFAVYQQ